MSTASKILPPWPPTHALLGRSTHSGGVDYALVNWECRVAAKCIDKLSELATFLTPSVNVSIDAFETTHCNSYHPKYMRFFRSSMHILRYRKQARTTAALQSTTRAAMDK